MDFRFVSRVAPLLGFALLSWSSAAQDAPAPIVIKCQLDTDLPLDELSVTLREKRELSRSPAPDGTVTLDKLPEGDLHLMFSRRGDPLGDVTVAQARAGELIRIRVRLVPGNAILLDDSRVKGIEGVEHPGAEKRSSDAPVVPPPTTSSVAIGPDADSRPAPGALFCPAPGSPIQVRGRLARVIDRDSIELLEQRRAYVIYIGSATRIRRGQDLLSRDDLKVDMQLLVEGAVAAGPEEECSVGAKAIRVVN